MSSTQLIVLYRVLQLKPARFHGEIKQAVRFCGTPVLYHKMATLFYQLYGRPQATREYETKIAIFKM